MRLSSSSYLHDELEKNVSAALAQRLESSNDYSLAEVERITKLNRGLFPKGYYLDQESTDMFRSLCALARADLIAENRISSHRPYVGTIIVAAKRLLWKFVRANLDETFKALQEYNSWLIYNQAKQHVAIAELRLALANSKSDQ